MSDIEAYEATLRQLDLDAENAQAVADAFTAAAANIRAALNKKSEVHSLPLFSAGTNGHRTNGANAVSKNATMAEVARFALGKAGKPLNVRGMWDVANANGWQYAGTYKSFRGSMAPALRRNPKLFLSSGPIGSGLYELVTPEGE